MPERPRAGRRSRVLQPVRGLELNSTSSVLYGAVPELAPPAKAWTTLAIFPMVMARRPHLGWQPTEKSDWRDIAASSAIAWTLSGRPVPAPA